ncbi:tetratricopeptide repeat protein [Glaciecola sp. XM2]|uniref:tetratricopeptide repeat protein n=1 Tax=Glaciecola sp. XM2 TaxID=1914931 RepID=UPI001BDF10CB|nr:tetratricopeptide repeat protein [Glaciecola sp. XM2]MBT1451545.1 tetratricopeptide repeat protein [Glaciecola sp. XM2]
MPRQVREQGFKKVTTTSKLGAALMLCVLSLSSLAQDDATALPLENTASDSEVLSSADAVRVSPAKQKADYQHVLFEYFQQNYASVLMLIDVGDQAHQFTDLEEHDLDRLRLMQGAAQLNLGLNTQAQELLLGLLSRTSSEYVQANTWYWLAKAGFENRQYTLSERAFEAIQTDELEKEITTAQWQELIYLNAFTRMQRQADWQAMYEQLAPNNIYPAYLQANLATSLFNQGDYAGAEEAFINAKQRLLRYQQIRDSWFTSAKTATQSLLSFDWLSFAWLNPVTWFSSDPNATAQGNIEQQALAEQTQEENALFDRINLGLSYALLQQQDEESALAVINTISEQGGESDQALLTLGWTLAQQNRWQQSLDIWEYLQQRSKGIFGLQASYGIAYAHQQQGQYANAFFALSDTSEQIKTSLDDLDVFTQQIQQDNFFDGFSQTEFTAQWPASLLDIKRMFLSTRPDFDAKYLLSVREQSQLILGELRKKQDQLDVLEQMLATRKQSFAKRQQSLSLSDAQAQLSQAQTQLEQMKALIAQSKSQNDEGVTPLALKIATPDQVAWMSRLENAKARHARLLLDDTRRRPVSPKYAERLARIQGVLEWQLQNDFIANRWEHLRLMQQVGKTIEQTQASYDALKARQQDSQLFARQQQQIERLEQTILQQQATADGVYQRSNTQLRDNLLAIIEQRKTQLNAQQVNTRLAMLRLQDLQPEVN